MIGHSGWEHTPGDAAAVTQPTTRPSRRVVAFVLRILSLLLRLLTAPGAVGATQKQPNAHPMG